MKKKILILFCVFTSFFVCSQQIQSKKIEVMAHEIELAIEGLDEVTINNSEGDWLELNLIEENPNATFVSVSTQYDYIKILFTPKMNASNQENGVFRKFITERINRAHAEIKIPKNKLIRIVGGNVDVISNNYEGDLQVYIEKGLVNFNAVQGDVETKLFKGNVFATIFDSNITINSTHGNIVINGKNHPQHYQKQITNSNKNFIINSINANVVLTTQ